MRHASPNSPLIRPLSVADLGDLLELQALIVASLSDPDLLAPYDPDWLAAHMEKQGVLSGCFISGRLVAYHHLFFPSAADHERNLGYDIGLTGDALDRVVNIQMVAVHPDHRSQGLAGRLNGLALETVRRENRWQHLCATVSPLNPHNLKLMFAAGLSIRDLKPKYGGKMRYVLHRNLTPVPLSETPRHARVVVDPRDAAQQKRLIGEGYRGVALSQGAPPDRSWKVVFVR